MAKTLAIDIGGTKFTIGGFEGSELILRESYATDREFAATSTYSQIEETVKRWREAKGFRPDRCGIGFGGPVDFQSQSVIMSTHVAGWAEFPLVERVRSFAGAPVVMDNDANVGALGESIFGAGRGLDPLFYMTLSTGIGGGVVIDRRIYHGANSYAGELGHMNIEPDGPECLCGSRGCFERMCCGLWLERDYGRPASELLMDPDFAGRYVVRLARGLKTVIMILNPARLIIGGGIAKAGDRLFLPLRQELGHQMTDWSRAAREIVPAQLGDDSVLFGALALSESYL
ncbi:MAG TPA: ROK family protein [Bryobacteraceae bacterium]|jgi:glucokinase|nr:ROK family protein [Bryobacteraceae bacterium]